MKPPAQMKVGEELVFCGHVAIGVFFSLTMSCSLICEPFFSSVGRYFFIHEPFFFHGRVNEVLNLLSIRLRDNEVGVSFSLKHHRSGHNISYHLTFVRNDPVSSSNYSTYYSKSHTIHPRQR